jgi:hypothetical protein
MSIPDESIDGWYAFDDGASLGETGTDGGVIARDEEHGMGARITLERSSIPGSGYCSITLGIYGWMVHTRFFDTREEADAAYETMRAELVPILDAIPMEDDPESDEKTSRASAMMSAFIDRHP